MMSAFSHKLCAALTLVIIGSSSSSIAEPDSHDDDSQEIYQFKQAKISLIAAIEIAEKALQGKAISGEFENDHDSYNYSIELLLPNGDIIEIVIDASTGNIVEKPYRE